MGGVALDGHALIGSPSSHRENQQLLVDGEFLALILDDHISGPSEPRFLKSARVGMARTWNGVQRTTRSAWETTKDVLRPYDPPQKTRKSQVRRKTDEGGFWSNLLGGQEPQDREVTVNDFLRQPAPQ